MTVIQRPLRGSRISSFYPVKSLPALSSLDSAFQLQEYISLLIRLNVHDVDTIVSLPGKSSGSEKSDNSGDDAKGEESEKDKDRKSEVAVDEACWIYEQLRRLAQDLSHPLITMLQTECTRASCPEMKAGEWLYLCVAHGNDGAMEQCCAIDYILHTLDSATALLNSPRAFPSRLSVPASSHRHFSSLARRLGRIFAHAYFHHREAFEQAEAESSLYARFLALTSKFELVPAEFLVIPTPSLSEGHGRDVEVQPPRLLAASVDRHSEIQELAADQNSTAELGSDLGAGDWDGKGGERGKNPPGLSSPGPARGDEHSARRYGRSRTDTMVFSEAITVAEELAKEHHEPAQEEPPAFAQPAEIALEAAEDSEVPPTLVIPPTEETEVTTEQPAITMTEPEAPSPDSASSPEDTFAPEDAPIAATEIQPAPAPSPALAEELTAPPSESAVDEHVAVTIPDTHEPAHTPDTEPVAEASHGSETSAETEPTPTPADPAEESVPAPEGAEESTHVQEPVSEPENEPETKVPTPSGAPENGAVPVPEVSAPTEAQLTEAQPIEAQSTEAQPTEAQPTEAQPTEAQPTETQSTESQPTEARPAVEETENITIEESSDAQSPLEAVVIPMESDEVPKEADVEKTIEVKTPAPEETPAPAPTTAEEEKDKAEPSS